MEIERGEAHQLEEYVDWRNKPVDKSKHGRILAGAFVLWLGVINSTSTFSFTKVGICKVEQFDENDGKEMLAVTFVVWVQDNKGWFWGFVLSIVSIALVLANQEITAVGLIAIGNTNWTFLRSNR
ncbi:hypothetical protein SUGI_0439140 [Cryptomeria japonica]|nr:hypothetical protein SUGI_0439140 [Cryptomeria japonica]